MREVSISAPDLLELATEILGRGERLRFRAFGFSMTPFICDGDLIEVEPIALDQVATGDILLLRDSQGGLLVHRVICRHLKRPWLLTKGDALSGPDKPAQADQILGRVAALHRDGRLIDLRSLSQRLRGWTWARTSPRGRWLCSLARRVLRGGP